MNPGTKTSEAIRFWKKVEGAGAGCWLWTAGTTRGGYGLFRTADNRAVYAHRWSYEYFYGPIATDCLDHVCRNRRCVNPHHLEAVTIKENARRGLWGVLRTHCVRGHELAGDNLYASRDGRRRCRACTRAEQRRNQTRRYFARKAKVLEKQTLDATPTKVRAVR